MQEANTFVTLEYDILAFDEQEVEELRELLSELGPVRSRVAYKERGGVETTLWAAITFVGVSFASGLIGHIAAKTFDKVVLLINNFYAKHRQKKPDYVQAIALRLSYDEIDIEVNLPGETRANFLQPLLQDVWKHLQHPPLSESVITKVHIPVTYDESEGLWWEAFVWSSADFNARYWGVNVAGTPYLNDVYDSYKKTLLGVPYDQINP